MLLPNYGVFDEKRYFHEGNSPVKFSLKGATLGITICEDLWEDSGPGKILCGQGNVDLLLNISSSPFHKGKGKTREKNKFNSVLVVIAPISLMSISLGVKMS
ncbi:MAG: hypothetical protein Ct9H300mP23_12170 [Nitrospinota bacterium]|nr:MAG: hypothetical protein Ct9H300mP23_12170 [Nitrospinota bacterium]